LIEPNLATYFGYRFEAVCEDYLSDINGNETLSFTFTELGGGGEPIRYQNVKVK
jgi:hypothetical protein